MRRLDLVSLVEAIDFLVGCNGRPVGAEPVSPFDINRLPESLMGDHASRPQFRAWRHQRDCNLRPDRRRSQLRLWS